ncbi:MAG: diaminopimelate epimerase [Phycisphaeraceae bacterium]|nr:diaminopimelate epimerase [Phycisphaeraceae bacterium]
MKLPFVKMHGLGNDYVYLDGFGDSRVTALMMRSRWSAMVRSMSDRHTGIGSDGVIVLTLPRASRNSVAMRMFNADGSEGRMCGNGARCVAKFAHERLALGERAGGRVSMRIEVGPPDERASVLRIMCELKRQKVWRATVDMGKPVLALAKMGVDRRKLAFEGVRPHWGVQAEVGRGVNARSICLVGVFVSMGNPHMVVMEPSSGGALNLTRLEVDSVPLTTLGPLFERHPAFKDRMNVHFAAVQRRRSKVAGGGDTIHLRTWERGAGPTRACASGACAALVAGSISGRCGREATVQLPGGSLLVRWDRRTGRVYQTGTAEDVFEGVWET